MAKRFISTDLFDDEWFCDLSKDAKLFFIYYITKCDHAGVLRLNKRLFEFQTGVKNFDTLIKKFDNCIVRVKEQLFFMPKFIKFQYPDFPKSNVRQQYSAIKILKELNLWDNENNTYLTVAKELPNSNGNDNVHEIVSVIDYEELRLLYNNNRDKLSECIALNDQRKGLINERVKEHGIEKVKEVILSACKSDFLNGKNDKNWKADFEWIVRPTNFLKILEGRFINSVETTQQKTNQQFFPR